MNPVVVFFSYFCTLHFESKCIARVVVEYIFVISRL